MKRLRLLFAFLAAGLTLVTGSCSSDQSPTGVTAASARPAADSALAFDGSQGSLLGGLLRPLGLLKCTPLPAATTTRTIGRDGGAIQVGPHTLWIPPGALDHDVTITATAPTADVNSVQFSPSGLEFERSAWLTMSYANCNLLGRLLPKRIAYTSDLLDILYYILSLDNVFTKQVIGKVDHFSKYAVSW
jgi:hypothetical protein